jgi:hypothetical protein
VFAGQPSWCVLRLLIDTLRFITMKKNSYGQFFLKSHSVLRRSKVITFLGNWSKSTKYLRGHATRLKSFISSIMSIQKDNFTIVDEYCSINTCNSGFSKTIKKLLPRETKITRIKGAIVCVSPICPARVTSRRTTTNRNKNGAKNIGWIGFSTMVLKMVLPLPPFRTSNYKSNKYVRNK